MAAKTVDLTGSERNSSASRLAGLRPLVDMPYWGVSAPADSPVPTEHARDLFCDIWQTMERAEGPMARPISACFEAGDYPDGVDAPTWPVPEKCLVGVDDVRAAAATFVPFRIELPRDADLCEDPTGRAIAARALNRLSDLTELAVLRQLWSAGIERRATSITEVAHDISGAAAVGPIEGYGMLVDALERSDHIGWTILGAASAKASMANRSIVSRTPDGWRDVHDQPVVFGGQPANWVPQSTGGSGPRTAPGAGESYLVGCGPVWYALDEPADMLDRGPSPDEAIRNQVSTRPVVHGIVMTRTIDVFAVRVDFS